MNTDLDLVGYIVFQSSTQNAGATGEMGGKPLTEEAYREIESSLRRSSRGRAFLAAHAERARVLAASEVMGAVAELRDAWNRRETSELDAQRVSALRHELQDMSASIAQARREISAIRPKEGNDRIMSAANELDQIVMSTERASIEILGAAERIMAEAGKLREGVEDATPVGEIENEVMNIFTACSFQDLTGQRTTKVVNALRYIERRIMKLMELWNADGHPVEPPPPDIVDTRPDAHLLNGPSADGIDQNDVDALMNGTITPSAPEASAQASPSAVSEEEPPTPLDQSSIDDLFS